MTAAADGSLHIYMLNVGQGDTTIIVTPEGQVIVFDAKNPGKVTNLLTQIGCIDTIEHLIISHPHADHFSAASRLAEDYIIEEATFPPFWHDFGMGPPTYRRLVSKLKENNHTNLNFLSGYSRWYPDDLTIAPAAGADPVLDEDAPFLELLGPTNNLIRQIEEARVFNTNHLSIIMRFNWGNFRMIVAGDAQMENWGPFDEEHLLERKVYLLRAAHHGSSNGTQWERLVRLAPTMVVISSKPDHDDELPDLASTGVFTKFDHETGQFAVITDDSGTIHGEVRPTGHRLFRCCGEPHDVNADLSNTQPLDEINNPTLWVPLLNQRIAQL